MKRFLMLFSLVALFLALSTRMSFAAECTQTGFFRDGMNMTAALINPVGTVSGEVNATGCNVGVYYDNGTGTLNNADIYGSNYFGVLVNGDVNEVTVNIRESKIHNIGEVPFNGAQHGVAVYYRSLGTGGVFGEISGSSVYEYQKGGIVVNGNATVDVGDNVVTGNGRVDYIAQNGVQFGWGASGVVRDNEITGNFYTGTVGVGPNPGGQNPPGWEYTSAGLLLYQSGNVKHSMNHYSGNQKNVSMVP